LLNRGESVHQLQRAVYSGKVAPERGRRREEMKAISGVGCHDPSQITAPFLLHCLTV